MENAKDERAMNKAVSRANAAPVSIRLPKNEGLLALDYDVPVTPFAIVFVGDGVISPSRA